MTDEQIFDHYFNGGNFALPYLLKFSCNELDPVYLVNNNENVEYNGNTYQATTFDYIPPDNTGKNASLKITGIDNSLVEFVENADENFRLDVVGVLAEGGEVQSIKQYTHFFGSVSYDNNLELSFELESDDRLDMTFPPYKFDTETNKGNT